MICESAVAGLVSSTRVAGGGVSFGASDPAALLIVENVGETASSKAIKTLAIRCRGLNLSILILFIRTTQQ